MKKATRRSLLVGAAATGAAELLPYARPARALTVLHPDAALLSLRPEWLRTRDAFEAALNIKGAIDAKIFSRSESYPDLKTFGESFKEYGDICASITARREALEAELGGDKLEDETSNANIAVVEKIEMLPAHTLAGLLFKVEVSKDWSHGREEMIDSIMTDIIALAAAEGTRLPIGDLLRTEA